MQKDASTVRPDLSGEGKQQHVVENCNFLDAGTSILLSAQVHDDFHAKTALEAVIQFLREHGCPQRLSFDHDPRSRWRIEWVGFALGTAPLPDRRSGGGSPLPSTPASEERLHRKIPSKLQGGMSTGPPARKPGRGSPRD
jgi:hypothetical protein